MLFYDCVRVPKTTLRFLLEWPTKHRKTVILMITFIAQKSNWYRMAQGLRQTKQAFTIAYIISIWCDRRCQVSKDILVAQDILRRLSLRNQWRASSFFGMCSVCTCQTHWISHLLYNRVEFSYEYILVDFLSSVLLIEKSVDISKYNCELVLFLLLFCQFLFHFIIHPILQFYYLVHRHLELSP